MQQDVEEEVDAFSTGICPSVRVCKTAGVSGKL